MHIRTFVDDDYPALTRLHNQVYGDFAKFEHELVARDRHVPEHIRWARFMAIDSDGRVVGFAQYHHSPYMFHPHRFGFDFAVDSQLQCHGVEERLYERILDALEPFQPEMLAAWARADMTCTSRFLTGNGFEPESQMFTSGLDLSAFNPAAWQDCLGKLERQGIQVRSLADLGVDVEAVRRSVYDMWCEVRQDVPIPEGETRSAPMPFERYWQEIVTPALLPSGFFLAFDGPLCIGTSQLFLAPQPEVLRTALTGVRKAYRRRGIALGLKVRALTLAKQLGYQRVVTDNAADNQGMLAINGALGFARNPVWTRYVRTFRQDPAAQVNG
jgi:GNAT superfamily N-acetyltransferase